jgi:hypothetical protein
LIFYHIKSIFIFIEEKIDDSTLTSMAIDQEEIIESNIEQDVEKVSLLISDENVVSNENGDGGNESDDNDDNENDDHVEGDNKLDEEKKDKDDDEDSKSSSSGKSESDREGNEEEDTSSANPSVHFFFNFVNAVEFSDCSHDRSLWTLKSFKEYLKKSFESEVENEQKKEQDAESESVQRVLCAKVFFIFRELNAIVGTALIYQKDILQSQDSDTVTDTQSLLCMYVCM